MRDDDTSIAGAFLNSEEATRLQTAIRAFDESMKVIEELNPGEVPIYTLLLVQKERLFVLAAGRDRVFEFQSGDDERIKHLRSQKSRLEAALAKYDGGAA